MSLMDGYFNQGLEEKIERLEYDLQLLQEDYDDLLAAFKQYFLEGQIRHYGESDMDDDELQDRIMHLVKERKKK